MNERLRDSDDLDLAKLHRELAEVRRRGYAINNQQTEIGLTAIGIAISNASGAPCAAVCLAMPTARYSRDHLPQQVTALGETAQRIEVDLERAAATRTLIITLEICRAAGLTTGAPVPHQGRPSAAATEVM